MGAHVGWFEAPPEARPLDDWVWHPLREVGWLMSLVTADLNGDGDVDLLLTDRRGPRRGVFWLENPGPVQAAGPWKEQPVGSIGRDEVMFLRYADLEGDGRKDLVSAVKQQHLHFYRRLHA